MAGVGMFGLNCSGHDCFPPRPNVQASTDVIVNGLGAQRLTDAYTVHCCPDKGCHDAVVAIGSSTVYVNGLPVARDGDQLSCLSKVANGSLNVIAGG